MDTFGPVELTTRKQPLLPIFATLALALATSVGAMFMMGRAVVRSNEDVVREQRAIDHLRATLLTLADAETGQRGFLLTHREEYLQPYQGATRRITEQLRVLESLTGDDGLSANEVEQFIQLANAKVADLERTIELDRSQGTEAALDFVRTGAGRTTMDRIRALSATMMEQEQRQVDAQFDRAKQLNFYRDWTFAGATLINLSLLLWAFRTIDNQRSAKERAALLLRDQKEFMEVTLASIGDGVIVTDVEGRITFMNETAENLTGWKNKEAQGLPCATVFNIVNESTRRLVESPVDKVLRLGTVASLANHTILIRKDRTEIPIDDSGAPIRRMNGETRGVVLVFRDFSDHQQAQRDLRRAMDEAQAANSAKDNFLANLSHELRTPLTPVAAALSIWEADRVLPAQLLPDLEMMRRNIDLEARLIDDLLDLTRIVRGKLVLNPEVADVNALVQSVAEMYRSDIRAKRLNLTITSRAKRHHVYADPARLQQVLWNILKNATKFTPAGGRIEIDIRNLETDRIQVAIRDDGIGMSEAVLAKLFVAFEQGAEDIVKRYGGLGLGMAISRTLMEAQGGSIHAESAGPGRGSTFMVILSCVDQPTGPRDPTPVIEVAKWYGSLNILLVEDNQDTARVLSSLLQRWGHLVNACSTVAEAKDLADQNLFDLILSDIGLPDGTGMDLIRHVRKTSKAMAIALSGFGMEADVTESRAAGFDEHLTKPINLQRLEILVSHITRTA